MNAMQDAHAIVVGISEYQFISKLPSTVINDAKDICTLLVDPQFCGYPEENVLFGNDLTPM